MQAILLIPLPFLCGHWWSSLSGCGSGGATAATIVMVVLVVGSLSMLVVLVRQPFLSHWGDGTISIMLVLAIIVMLVGGAVSVC